MTTGDGDAGGRLFPEDLDGVDPVAAVVLADARRALSAYPELVVVGALFTAAEQVRDGWQVVCQCDPLPQGARELLAVHLEERAADGAPDRAGLLAAARRLQDEPVDEVTAGGRRFRIVRIEQLVRTGPDGPEPPRPTDLDEPPAGGRGTPSRPYDLLAEDGPAADFAMTELLCQVLDAAAAAGGEPSGAYLTPVALAPAFTVAERTERRWRPVGRLHDAPRQARDALVTYFRHVVPAVESPGATDVAQFAEAAELMADDTRRNGIAVAGRRFRIVRVERITLLDPDGPEPPRPTDFDAR
ncbi:DUF5954 family protein [Actinomadura decatromicini]|uniref:PE-PGRS family protein n=1 Tax=Actinomadura decatromicini TaxID=2604572 RepID=A0A5D3FIV7_9ACTN|nr:DUF5954 family protein [Actinomadura decatromicini]TYK47958.1 hypothetical protein FXF68_19910 [Actinomadura decatromicini]